MPSGTRSTRTFAAFRAALASPVARTASGLRDVLLRYDGSDVMDTARWQRIVAGTPFAKAWWSGRRNAPHATTLVDTDTLRVRVLYWHPGLVVPFHDHPGFDLVAMRVLCGSPLQEHVAWFGDAVGGQSVRRELVPGDVSVIPGAGAQHRVQVKFGDMSTQTLSVELPATDEC